MRYIYPARTNVQAKTHPVIYVAAVSIIFFSVAFGAALLGYSPLALSHTVQSEVCTPSAGESSGQPLSNQALNRGAMYHDSVTRQDNDTADAIQLDRQVYDSDMPTLNSSSHEFDVYITKA